MYFRPHQIEEQITLQIDNNGYPQSGIIKFRNGFMRDCTSGELNLYWNEFNTRQALWHYLESQGKLFNASSTSIPEKFYGKMTKVTTQAGKEYFGKLQKLPNDTLQFGLLDDGACCGPTIIDKDVVSTIQQIK